MFKISSQFKVTIKTSRGVLSWIKILILITTLKIVTF